MNAQIAQKSKKQLKNLFLVYELCQNVVFK